MKTELQVMLESRQGKGAALGPLQAYAAQKGVPLIGYFELTRHCNLSCNMCYMRPNDKYPTKRELSTDEWLRIASEARDEGMLTVMLTGGEPLFRDDFKQIYEKLIEMGLTISILSNGALMDESFVNWLKRRPPLSIGLSLYGASEDTYEKLCHNGKAFSDVMRALELLKKAGIKVLVKSLILPENEYDIPKIREMAEKNEWNLQVSSNIFAPRFDSGRCLTSEYDDYIYGVSSTQMSAREADETINENTKLINSLKEWKSKYSLPKNGLPCFAGRSLFWVTWYGQMQACASIDKPMYSLCKGNFKEGWDLTRKELSESTLPNECFDCNYLPICRLCPSVHYLENGSVSMLNTRACTRTKKQFSDFIRRSEK